MLNLKNVVDGHSKNMQQSKKNLQPNTPTKPQMIKKPQSRQTSIKKTELV